METPAYLLALRAAYDLHPVFKCVPPTSAVLLEHPHVAETDPSKIAYTRSQRDGEDFLVNGHKRQTLTSITKYLTRHYPNLPSHEIFTLSQSLDEFELITDIREIIFAVETGPSSCMKSASSVCRHMFDMTEHTRMMLWRRDNGLEEPEWDLHPYIVYDYPGWSLAVHRGLSPLTNKPAIVGRALVYKNRFVRSFYQASTPEGYSLADIALESWLSERGVNKYSEWAEGTPIKHIDTGDGPLVPYIDGCNYYVNVYCGSNARLEIVERGEYECQNTNGAGTLQDEEEEEEDAEGLEYLGSCDLCDDPIYDGDSYNRIRDDDLCCTACSCNLVDARADNGRGGYRIWAIPESAAVEVDGYQYDSENLPDNIVALFGEGYAKIDDCCSIGHAWYLCDDDRVVLTEDDLYQLKSDCWEDADGNYHSNAVASVSVGGALYRLSDERTVIDYNGNCCLRAETWEDGFGNLHSNNVPSHELDGKLYTAAQVIAFLSQNQLELPCVI